MKEPTESLPNSKFWRFQQFSLVVSQDGSVHMAEHPLSSPSFPGNTKVVCTCSGSCNAVDANCVEKARQTKEPESYMIRMILYMFFFKGVFVDPCKVWIDINLLLSKMVLIFAILFVRVDTQSQPNQGLSSQTTETLVGFDWNPPGRRLRKRARLSAESGSC